MLPTKNADKKGIVLAVCVSDKKGVIKKDAGEGLLLENFGIEGDAHAGDTREGFTHRQVSLLAQEDVDTMKAALPDLIPGSFAENITTQVIDLGALAIGDRLQMGNAVLEISQIGKECHTKCQIYHTTGDCIMPKKGLFAKVIAGGKVIRGDSIVKI